jgi:hypothetical protein
MPLFNALQTKKFGLSTDHPLVASNLLGEKHALPTTLVRNHLLLVSG